MHEESRDLKRAVCTWWPTMTYHCQKVGMQFGDMAFMRADGACKDPVQLDSFCKVSEPGQKLFDSALRTRVSRAAPGT